MKNDSRAIAGLLDIPEERVKVDRYLYVEEHPDEIKAWKVISKDDPDLRQYEGELYYPATSLFELIDITTELLVKKMLPAMKGLPAMVTTDIRFKKPVRPETELLIQVKLLRNYKGRIGIFSGVIADSEGDIVAENISKGTSMSIASKA